VITYSCFLGESDHDQAIIGDHDETRITDHGRTRMSDHDGQEYPGAEAKSNHLDLVFKMGRLYMDDVLITEDETLTYLLHEENLLTV